MGVLTLPISHEIEELVNNLSVDKKNELAQLITLWLTKPRSILEVMEEIGQYATTQDLTDKKLKKLLDK